MYLLFSKREDKEATIGSLVASGQKDESERGKNEIDKMSLCVFGKGLNPSALILAQYGRGHKDKDLRTDRYISCKRIYTYSSAYSEGFCSHSCRNLSAGVKQKRDCYF